MKSTKNGENPPYDTKIPVASGVESGDTLGMQLVNSANFADLQNALSGIAARNEGNRHGNIVTRIIRIMRSAIVNYVRMRAVSKDLSRMACEFENEWRDILKKLRTKTDFYAATSDEQLAARERYANSVARCETLDRNLASLTNAYPKMVRRSRSDLARCKQVWDDLQLLIPDSDEEKLLESHRQYSQGTLVAPEAFVNGLQGV